MKILRAKSWHPVGAGISFGIVEILSFLLSKRPLGASRAFVESCSVLTYIFFKEHFYELSYYKLYMPQFTWVSALIAGVFFGSLLSSKISGDFKFRAIPQLWRRTFGPHRALRWSFTFIGGVLVALGGRFAHGCISGQLIKGITQLSPGGFVFLFAVLLGGISTAFLCYRIVGCYYRR
ncbi:MAG: hypothetical protein D6828_05685 [Nitrospirae bacterium]|nr:MAG: hypothetical protein D6828_05685 [Nitrospirota bacterium]